MQEIQNLAIQTYLENLEFFKNNHSDLYERIHLLSNAIDNNQYKERYHLEYIQKDQEFDIYDSLNEIYLYNKKPKEFIDQALANTNLDKKNSIDLLNPEIYNRQQKYDITKQKKMETKTLAKVHNDIYDYTTLFKKSTINPNKEFLQIEKFLFVGSLLGRHIEPIALKLKTMLLFIFEKNLEIFRLSLFTTNYATISSRYNIVMIFSIMEDKNKEFSKLKKFYSYEVYSNHMIKYYSTNYNIGNFFDILLSIITSQSPMSFSYERMFDYLISPICENISHYPTLDTQIQHSLLKSIPILFLAAGPSLGHNIQWIKKHKKKFFIVAVGAAIKTLIAEDIIPEIITSADGDEIICQQFPLEIRDKIQNTLFLTASSTHVSVLNIFPSQNVILFELMCLLKKHSSTIHGYSVGEVTLKLLTLLGADTLYMLGTDMALDQETGKSHTPEHDLQERHTLSQDKKEANYFMKNKELKLKEGTVAVQGNFRDIVVTTTSMINSINAYKYNMKIIKQQNPNIQIYNLCDGAYLEDIIPLKIDQVLVPSKQKNNINIIKELQNFSSLGISKEDIDNINMVIKIITSLISSIKKLKKIQLKSYQDFRNKRERILCIIHQQLAPYSSLYANNIFNRYYLIMESYLGFQFNEKLTNEKELVNQVKLIWCEHMLRLTSQYKSTMSKLTNI